MGEVQSTIPLEFREDAEAFPPALRALLEAELAAGNRIAESGHGFPSPPAGGYFIMTGPVTTRPRQSGDGLNFRDYGHSLYSGSFTDDRGFFFILEPPVPPPPQPSMDAIRAAHAPPPFRPSSAIDSVAGDPNVGDRGVKERGTGYRSEVPIADPDSALGRFQRSMVMDYEKWHDGVGYDLEALAAATPAERDAIETILLERGTKDWRDVEALAALHTPLADRALKGAIDHSNHEIALAVARCAPRLIPEAQRTASLVSALKTASLGDGLSQALDQAAEFHPKEVVDALFQGALRRDGESAVSFAALLLFVHHKADSPFDWNQRPFFLRFNTPDRVEREAVFTELCGKIGVDSSKYL
jgi:hypothetical protein